MSQSFTVLFPPGVNQIWRAVGGRVILSARYRTWRDAAGIQLMLQRAKPVRGAVAITIELVSPTKRAYDLDGRIKGVIDLLVEHGVIEDDHSGIVQSVFVSKGNGGPGARVTVTPIAEELAQ